MIASSRRLVLLYAASALLLLACESAVAPPSNAPSAGTPLFMTSTNWKVLAVCAKATYDSTAVSVGSAGGTIKLAGQTLVIPSNALSSTVMISMVIPGDTTASVRFHPDGLQFNSLRLPMLTLSYKGCSTGTVPTNVYTDDKLNVLQLLSTLSLDVTNNKVSAYISHFSRYAVHW